MCERQTEIKTVKRKRQKIKIEREKTEGGRDICAFYRRVSVPQVLWREHSVSHSSVNSYHTECVLKKGTESKKIQPK